jgi:hypothetical protein
MSRTDYWGEVIPTVRVREVWEYELAGSPEQQHADEAPVGPYWVEEDDENSAMWKAVSDGATGRVRSYTVTTSETEPVIQQSKTREELLAKRR